MAFSFKKTRRHVLAMALALCAAPALAQQAANWPTKPIRLVVPFPPGGPTDTASRIIGQELSESLGQSIIVENRAGASGAIGARNVIGSANDGYTIMTLATPTLLAPHLYPNSKYDSNKDFAPIATFYDLPLVIVVNPDVLDVHSLEELVAAAKAEEGGLNYTSAGVGSLGFLGIELMKQMGEFDMLHVPYGGSAPAITDLLGGQVPMMYSDLIAALPHIKAGKLRAIAVGSPERLEVLPEVKTVAEQGFPGYAAVSWGGLVAPVGTPQNVIDRIAKEVEVALQKPAVQQRMAGAGAIAHYEGPADMAKRVHDDNTIWGGLVREKNLSMD